MQRLRARDGIQPSEQVRRGLRQFLEAKGVLEKSDCGPSLTPGQPLMRAQEAPLTRIR
jgi:hypothetical protein